MTWLVNLVIGWGVPAKAARIVAFAMIALIVVLLLWGAKAAYDAAVVEDAFTELERDDAREARKADHTAAEQRLEDQARHQQETKELEEAIENAATDPTIDDALEQRIAFHRCLSLQQRARDAGLEPPTCS